MARRPIRPAEDGRTVEILDQTLLPHQERWVALASVDDAVRAIGTMQVRGAPLIGVAAAYGLALGLRQDPGDAGMARAVARLRGARPTAVNPGWALDRLSRVIRGAEETDRARRAWEEADRIAEEEAGASRAIGDHGLSLLRTARQRRGTEPVRILTHCNTGWLATVEYGTALAPVYRARETGVPVHVWVSETRPRNQGWLTAWELSQAGVPHTLIADNAAGHLLQRGEVDLVLVGTDRTTRRGDVCNKIGTYLKALAAREAGVPFYAAVPSSSIDWAMTDGRDVPIEERGAGEVLRIRGRGTDGQMVDIALGPDGTRVTNPAFDVTPAELVTGLVTERGICPASAGGLRGLFPEQAT